MFFDWKIQPEKVQLTRDLKDDTILYQGIRLPCKNDHGYCDPTTRTQATNVWFPEETCAVFQVAKIHARLIKFHQNILLNQSHLKKSILIKSEAITPTLETSAK